MNNPFPYRPIRGKVPLSAQERLIRDWFMSLIDRGNSPEQAWYLMNTYSKSDVLAREGFKEYLYGLRTEKGRWEGVLTDRERAYLLEMLVVRNDDVADGIVSSDLFNSHEEELNTVRGLWQNFSNGLPKHFITDLSDMPNQEGN